MQNSPHSPPGSIRHNSSVCPHTTAAATPLDSCAAARKWERNMFYRNLMHLFPWVIFEPTEANRLASQSCTCSEAWCRCTGTLLIHDCAFRDKPRFDVCFLSVSPPVSGGALWMITSKHECLLCSLKLQETWLPSPKLPFWISEKVVFYGQNARR